MAEPAREPEKRTTGGRRPQSVRRPKDGRPARPVTA
jgi:hypothetical protein